MKHVDGQNESYVEQQEIGTVEVSHARNKGEYVQADIGCEGDGNYNYVRKHIERIEKNKKQKQIKKRGRVFKRDLE